MTATRFDDRLIKETLKKFESLKKLCGNLNEASFDGLSHDISVKLKEYVEIVNTIDTILLNASEVLLKAQFYILLVDTQNILSIPLTKNREDESSKYILNDFAKFEILTEAFTFYKENLNQNDNESTHAKNRALTEYLSYVNCAIKYERRQIAKTDLISILPTNLESIQKILEIIKSNKLADNDLNGLLEINKTIQKDLQPLQFSDDHIRILENSNAVSEIFSEKNNGKLTYKKDEKKTERKAKYGKFHTELEKLLQKYALNNPEKHKVNCAITHIAENALELVKNDSHHASVSVIADVTNYLKTVNHALEATLGNDNDEEAKNNALTELQVAANHAYELGSHFQALADSIFLLALAFVPVVLFSFNCPPLMPICLAILIALDVAQGFLRNRRFNFMGIGDCNPIDSDNTQRLGRGIDDLLRALIQSKPDELPTGVENETGYHPTAPSSIDKTYSHQYRVCGFFNELHKLLTNKSSYVAPSVRPSHSK